jgi:aromatic ring-cleaving dioxygenase
MDAAHQPVDPSRITDYHVHVYYDAESRDRAALLREWVESRFPTVRMGRWHDVPVGPHPTAMYQIQFPVELYATLAPFIMMNRMGLTVLLHPESGRPRDDHTLNATWMGEVLTLNTGMLRETDQPA